MDSGVFDKKGYPIRSGDILKVYHFTGARNKKHYMYKMAWIYTLENGQKILMASHLGEDVITEGIVARHSYRIPLGHLEDYEIVQGYCNEGDELSFEDRPRAENQEEGQCETPAPEKTSGNV